MLHHELTAGLEITTDFLLTAQHRSFFCHTTHAPGSAKGEATVSFTPLKPVSSSCIHAPFLFSPTPLICWLIFSCELFGKQKVLPNASASLQFSFMKIYVLSELKQHPPKDKRFTTVFLTWWGQPHGESSLRPKDSPHLEVVEDARNKNTSIVLKAKMVTSTSKFHSPPTSALPSMLNLAAWIFSPRWRSLTKQVRTL